MLTFIEAGTALARRCRSGLRPCLDALPLPERVRPHRQGSLLSTSLPLVRDASQRHWENPSRASVRTLAAGLQHEGGKGEDSKREISGARAPARGAGFSMRRQLLMMSEKGLE